MLGRVSTIPRRQGMILSVNVLREVMAAIERVTITLPADMVRKIDRLEKNRSRFIQDATRHELDRRRRERLQRSLGSPHPETVEFAGDGFKEWASGLPEEDAAALVDLHTGIEVQWVPGKGWTEVGS